LVEQARQSPYLSVLLIVHLILTSTSKFNNCKLERDSDSDNEYITDRVRETCSTGRRQRQRTQTGRLQVRRQRTGRLKLVNLGWVIVVKVKPIHNGCRRRRQGIRTGTTTNTTTTITSGRRYLEGRVYYR
jgi:hypothetical protein